MTDLRIADAPELSSGQVQDGLKIPTGGYGNYSITMITIRDWLLNYKMFATQSYVNAQVGVVTTALNNHTSRIDNPHQVTKSQVGLSNVDNTSDINKPVSAATQTALTNLNTSLTSAISVKANAADVYTKSEVFNKAESDGKYHQKLSIDGILAPTAVFDDVKNLDGVNGTPDSIINQPIQNLANRTEFLKTHNNLVGRSSANSHPSEAISYGNITQKKYNDGVESIAELLAIQNPFHGMRVYVKSYYAGENKGGGSFYYDSTQSAVNNGVTIFNGWVRDLSDRYLSTYDAGLKEDATNATVKLQAIADSLQNNFTFEIFDKHLVNKRIRFLGVSNLKVIGSGEVSAKELRDTWTFENHYGVLFFQDCPYLTVSKNIKVTGAKKFWTTNADPTQAGDSPISLKNCPHSLIEHTTLSHAVAWGIVAENSPYTIAQFNKIDDIVRQSGINLVINGGQYCKVLNNKISNVGLYGIEWETYDPSLGNICNDNTITDCFKGIAITGDDLLELTASNNTIDYCYNGIDTFPLLNAVSVNAHNNNGVGCYIALSGSSTKNVTYSDNNFDYSVNKGWLQSNASNFIIKFGTDRTQIYTFTDSTITNGQTVYIKDVAHTVGSVTTVSDNSFAPSVTQLKLITLSTSVAVNVPEYTFIKTPVTQANSSGLFASLTNTKLKFINNVLNGYGRGISHQTNYNSIATGREYYLGNKFIDCTNWLYIPTSVATGALFKGTTITGANSISINHRNTVQYLFGLIKTVSNPTAKTSGTSVLTIPFTIDEATWRFKVRVSFVGASTTGTIVIRIDGVDSYTISQADFAAASSKIFEISGWSSISQGNHTLLITDTVGDLVFSSYQVDMYLS